MSRSFFRTYGFLSAMLLAIVLGCVLGALWPGATCLAPLGTIFINLMFCIVVPLVFCSLSSSIACMKSPKRAGRIMGTTLLVFIVTGLIAAVIMLFAMRLYPPVLEPWADAAAGAVDEQASVAQLLVNFFTVEDFAALLSRRAMLPLIVFSILIGFANLCGMGGAPLAAIRMGAGDNKSAGKIMGNAFTALSILGAVLTALVLLFKRELLFVRKHAQSSQSLRSVSVRYRRKTDIHKISVRSDRNHSGALLVEIKVTEIFKIFRIVNQGSQFDFPFNPLRFDYFSYLNFHIQALPLLPSAISTEYFLPCLVAAAFTSVRIDMIIFPCLPMTLPTSDSATLTYIVSPSSPSGLTSTETSSGYLTRRFTRYSTNSFIFYSALTS